MNELTLKLKNISLSFGNKDIFDIENMSAYMNDRIAIRGNNGAGKSTLLKIIAGEFKEFTGKVQRETEFNYLSQIGEENESTDNYTDYEMLSRMNVPENKNLSGGETTRVSLALMFVKPSNVIILDEPTNFIDLITIEALEKFIKAYQGTIILTSHDQYFLERTADQIYSIKNQKLQRIK